MHGQRRLPLFRTTSGACPICRGAPSPPIGELLHSRNYQFTFLLVAFLIFRREKVPLSRLELGPSGEGSRGGCRTVAGSPGRLGQPLDRCRFAGVMKVKAGAGGELCGPRTRRFSRVLSTEPGPFFLTSKSSDPGIIFRGRILR